MAIDMNTAYISAELRREAEKTVSLRSATSVEPPEGLETKQLLHELQVHQVELEMQNEELLSSQEELEASRSKYFDLYDLAPIGYLTLSEKGVILEANLTAATMFGMVRNDLLKKPLNQIIFAEDQDIYTLRHKRLLESKAPQTWEMRMVRADGSPFWAHLQGSQAQNSESWIVITDITERKKVETALVELRTNQEQRVRERTEELRQAREVAVSADLAKSRLLSVVAHEFRTPLGLLVVSVSILDRYRDRLPFEKLEEMHEQIRHATTQMTQLVDSVLAYSRQETKSLTTAPIMLDIAETCRNIAKEINTVWGADHIFNVIIASDCGRQMLSDINLWRILSNLLTNAFRYTPPGGTVTLTVSVQAERLLIQVADTGIGIPEEDLEMIFEAFYRCNNVGSRYGMGLGLSIVDETVRLMNGSIRLASKAGDGTTFWVELPLENSEERLP